MHANFASEGTLFSPPPPFGPIETKDIDDEKSFETFFLFSRFRSIVGSSDGDWIRSNIAVWFVSAFDVTINVVTRQGDISYLVQRGQSEANLFVSILSERNLFM